MFLNELIISLSRFSRLGRGCRFETLRCTLKKALSLISLSHSLFIFLFIYIFIIYNNLFYPSFLFIALFYPALSFSLFISFFLRLTIYVYAYLSIYLSLCNFLDMQSIRLSRETRSTRRVQGFDLPSFFYLYDTFLLRPSLPLSPSTSTLSLSLSVSI